MAARIQADKNISAPMFKRMLIAGAKMLDVNKATVDALNVFPVPDGDTGTNMSLTMNSAIKEINLASSNSMEAITTALAKGALRGARGNSGVILSQIMKGIASTVSGSEYIDAKLFAKALKAGVEIAYGAVVKPKEGTILTVARVTAEHAQVAAKKSANMAGFLENIIAKSEEILAQTPEMLDVLKKAGVVDSGGYGLVCVFKGMLKGYLGEE
ncbi:MAG: DAK2 domain-containing protein, partial [Clostridia bacterium]|nr:DAK2 domain-containing protein [Clostridia bacterium]